MQNEQNPCVALHVAILRFADTSKCYRKLESHLDDFRSPCKERDQVWEKMRKIDRENEDYYREALRLARFLSNEPKQFLHDHLWEIADTFCLLEKRHLGL